MNKYFSFLDFLSFEMPIVYHWNWQFLKGIFSQCVGGGRKGETCGGVALCALTSCVFIQLDQLYGATNCRGGGGRGDFFRENSNITMNHHRLHSKIFYTVPKVIDFPRYNTKCGGENEILGRIFCEVFVFYLHFVLYLGNLDYFLDSVDACWAFFFRMWSFTVAWWNLNDLGNLSRLRALCRQKFWSDLKIRSLDLVFGGVGMGWTPYIRKTPTGRLHCKLDSI